MFEHDTGAPLHNTAYTIEVMRKTWEAMGKLILDDPDWEAPGDNYDD